MLSGEGQLEVALGKKLRLTEKGLECLAREIWIALVGVRVNSF